jgi:hypothetical protein
MTENSDSLTEQVGEFEIVDMPENLRRRGRWNNLIEQLKNLPEGKAIRVPLSKFGQNGKDLPNARSAIYAAARAEGVRASIATMGEHVFISRTNEEE